MTIKDKKTIAELARALQEVNSCVMRVNEAYLSLLSDLEEERWVGIAKATEISGLTPRQLRYKAERGEIKSRRQGKLFYFLDSDLAKYSTQP